jgi:LDH2 family malate/lactate/ureidoglycolate dehydrogenase
VPRVRLDDARAAAEARLAELGFDAPARALLAEHYLDAELCGQPSHGLERVRWLASLDGLDPGARPSLVERQDGLARWNAAGVVGYLALAEALDAEAADPPRGARVVVVERCYPTGRLGWFAQRPARAGLLCLLTATSPPRLPHPDGGPPLAGTNPLCLAVPDAGGETLAVDVSMGRLTHGDVIAAAAAGAPLPGDAAVDAAGRPVTDPAEVVAGRAGIRPAGGDQPHKGFALAVLVELLAAALAPHGGHTAVAVLAPADATAARDLRARGAGHPLPGERSRARRAGRIGRGDVELPDGLWEWLRR